MIKLRINRSAPLTNWPANAETTHRRAPRKAAGWVAPCLGHGAQVPRSPLLGLPGPAAPTSSLGPRRSWTRAAGRGAHLALWPARPGATDPTLFLWFPDPPGETRWGLGARRAPPGQRRQGRGPLRTSALGLGGEGVWLLLFTRHDSLQCPCEPARPEGSRPESRSGAGSTEGELDE